jgi:hypothetical protein
MSMQYPIFEDNQVLTSTQLNNLRVYLDEENRLSRVNLVGIGVGNGLVPSETQRSGNKAVNISCGTAVTSEGYLIKLGDSVNYSVKRYTLPAGMPYAPFMDGSIQDVKLYELLSTDSPVLPAMLLDDALTSSDPDFGSTFLDDKAVILFVECADIDNDSCLGRKCDENGISRTFTLRKLLVNFTDLDKIKMRSDGGLPDPLNEAKYDLEDITMRRPLFDALAANSQNYLDFSVNYATSFRSDTFPKLMDELENTYFAYLSILEPVYGTNPFQHVGVTNLVNTWTNYLNGGAIGSAAPYFGVQYFYDFVKDLIYAYNEFRDVSFDLATECCINMTRFPRHVMAGSLNQLNICGITPYRHEFIYASLQEHQKEIADKAVMLHKRMVMMLYSFEFTLISNPPALINTYITPSDEKQTYLSNRSVPFYYNLNNPFQYTPSSSIDPYDQLSRNWSYEVMRRCRIKNGIPQLLSYDNQAVNQLIDSGPVGTPFYYTVDPFNFLRIEGHFKKGYVQAMAEINVIKNRFDLPFNMIALRLQGSALDSIADRCSFDDLTSSYTALRNSLICTTSAICDRIAKQVGYGTFFSRLLSDSNATVGTESVVFNPQTILTAQAQIGTLYTVETLNSGSNTAGSAETVNGGSTTVNGGVGVVNEGVGSPNLRTAGGSTVSGTSTVGPPRVVGGTADVTAVSGPNVTGSSSDTLLAINNFNVALGSIIIDRDTPLESLLNDYTLFMNTFCSKLNTLRSATLLPFDFKAFKFGADISGESNSFIKTWASAISYAISSKVAFNRVLDFILHNTKKRPTPEEYFVLGQYASEVIAMLNDFISSCLYKEFESLYATYQYRLTWLRDNDPTLFSNFIKLHPGIDHKAGVPMGGTFILVYNGNSISVDIPSRDEAVLNSRTINDIECQIANLLNSGGPLTEQQNLTLIQLQAELSSCFELADQLVQDDPAITIEQIQLQQDQVIADFALPYLCCCDCSCDSIPNPTQSQLNLQMPTYTMPVFVEYNMGDYAFGTEVWESTSGCSLTVPVKTIEMTARVNYNSSAGTSFRLRLIQGGVARSYDLIPDANGVFDSMTTEKGGRVDVVKNLSAATNNTNFFFKYTPRYNFLGVDTFAYMFEVHSVTGKKLSSTPGLVHVSVSPACGVIRPQDVISVEEGGTENS